MVSDKKIHRDLELIQLYKQNPLEKFFIFTIYQNYALALMIKSVKTFFTHIYVFWELLLLPEAALQLLPLILVLPQGAGLAQLGPEAVDLALQPTGLPLLLHLSLCTGENRGPLKGQCEKG